MARETIIIELIDRKVLHITGALELEHELSVRMLEEALKEVKSHKGKPSLVLAGEQAKFVDLNANRVNHQYRKIL